MYEVLALRYADLPGRMRRRNILNLPLEQDAPQPLTFYVWLIRGAGRTVLVDTGIGAGEAAGLPLASYRPAAAAVRSAGTDPDSIQDVILTHLHYDHAGSLADFPNARFHVQASELAHATGQPMSDAGTALGYNPEVVCDVIRSLFAGRVHVHDGTAEVAPGVAVHLVRSHTPGLQAVCVDTVAGQLVLASDSAMYYENLETGVPSLVLWHLGDMYNALRDLKRLASAPHLIIPGHDPLVMERFPALSPELSGAVALLAGSGESPSTRRT